MDKFIKVINKILKINWEKITDEAKINKGKSGTLNKILGEEYKEYSTIQNTKNLLLKIWIDIIDNALKEKETNKIIKNWIKLYKILDRVIKTLYQNENTSQNVFTLFRKPIRQKYGDNSQIYIQSTYVLGIGQERALERREEYQNKVDEKGLNRQSLPPIYDDEIYSAIDIGFHSSDPLETVIAIMLNTGSRSIEVLKVSTYSEVKDNPLQIHIKGIAKDRTGKGYENKEIVRPLINLNAQQIIEAVKYIRENLNLKGTNEAISSRYSQTMNKRMKKLFPTHPELTVHKCRYISAQMAYLLFGNNGVENTYIQQYLGHEDSSTSRTYQSINIKLRQRPDNITPTFEGMPNSTISDSLQTAPNISEHDKIKEAINQIKAGKIKVIKPTIAYPQFINPRSHLGDVQKIKLLTSLMKKAKEDGVVLNQANLKKNYKYGSSILSLFWKLMRDGQIII